MNKIKSLMIAFLIFACMVCLSVGLVACGSDEPSENVPEQGTEQTEGDGDETEEGHVHSAVYVDEKAATCTAEGNTAYWYCAGCGKYFSDEGATAEIDAESVVMAKTAHELTKTDGVAATCEAAGSTDFWTCSVCNNMFSDAGGTKEILASDTVIPATGHSTTFLEAESATCTEEGNIACWQCESCGKYFSDEGASTEIAESDAVIATVPHSLTKTEGTAATCTTEGKIDYWTCSVCHNIFSNEAGTKQITDADIVIKPTHDVVYKPAVAATCTATGTIAHFECTGCDKYFSDALANHEIETSSVVTDMTPHSVTEVTKIEATCTSEGTESYYQCSICGMKCSDAGGTEIIQDENSLVISKLPHTLGEYCEYVDGKEGYDSQTGHYTYFECSVCHGLFEDAGGNTGMTALDSNWITTNLVSHTNLIKTWTDDDNHTVKCPDCGYSYSEAHTIVQDNDGICSGCNQNHLHVLEKVDGVAVTCDTDGTMDYYFCPNCQKKYFDEGGENEVTDESSLIIQSTGHNVAFYCDANGTTGHYSYYICSLCSRMWNDEALEDEVVISSGLQGLLDLAQWITDHTVSHTYEKTYLNETQHTCTCTECGYSTKENHTDPLESCECMTGAASTALTYRLQFTVIEDIGVVGYSEPVSRRRGAV